jgi:hypothetical protein
MGTYYAWVCDEKREYFDPMDLPYYGNKYEAIPHSAWAVAVLALTCWSGCDVRLINDNSDEFYDRVRENSGPDREAQYTNVTDWALGTALQHRAIPEDGMRNMAIDLLGAVKAATLPIDDIRAALIQKYPDPGYR